MRSLQRPPPQRPSRQRVPVDRLADGPDPSVELRAIGDAACPAVHRGPRRVQCRHRGACNTEAVLRVPEEVVVVRTASCRGSSSHSGLHLHPLCMLPLALVRVLVAAERLRRREVPAAVVTLEFAVAVGGGDGSTAALRGGSRGDAGAGGFCSPALR